LIVRGKEQGYLMPDDIRSTFPDLQADRVRLSLRLSKSLALRSRITKRTSRKPRKLRHPSRGEKLKDLWR